MVLKLDFYVKKVSAYYYVKDRKLEKEKERNKKREREWEWEKEIKAKTKVTKRYLEDKYLNKCKKIMTVLI